MEDKKSKGKFYACKVLDNSGSEASKDNFTLFT